MFISYKTAVLNYLAMTAMVFFVTLVQNSLWPAVFGTYAPLYLWPACVVYWTLYHKPGSAVFIIYLVSLSTASTSSQPFGCILLFNSLIFMTIIFFKRIYYTNFKFFGTALVIALLCLPLIFWLFSLITDGKSYFYGFLPYLAGILASWLFSCPVFGMLKYIDHLTHAQTAENRPLETAL